MLSVVSFHWQLAGHLLVQKPSLPIVERCPFDTEFIGDILGRPPPCDEVDDGALLRLFGDVRRIGALGSAPRLQLVYPRCEKLLGRISEGPHRACEASTVLEEMIDRGPPLLFGVSAMAVDRWYVASVREVFLVPCVKGRAARIPEFADDRCRAEVVSDE